VAVAILKTMQTHRAATGSVAHDALRMPASSLEQIACTGLRQLLLVLATIILCGCGEPHHLANADKLQWVEHADADSDAARALAANDHRLMAIYGNMLVIPGVDSGEQARYMDLYGVHTIEGTGDMLDSPEGVALVAAATDYAVRYNSFVLARVQLK
jgi:hypothetical protein